MESRGGFYDSPQHGEYTGIKTVRNLTAKQLEAMQVDEGSTIYLLDRAEVSNLVVSGFVSSVKSSVAGLSFKVFDTTAEVDCVFWFSGSSEEQVTGGIQDGDCVKVVGSLKVFNNKKSVNAISVMKVDVNYLMYNLAAAWYQHLYHTGTLSRAGGKKDGASKIHRDILELYRKNQSDEEGLDIDIVVRMMSGKYTEEEIRKAMEELLSDCKLYWVFGASYKTTL